MMVKTDFFEGIIDSMVQNICIIDRNGLIIATNRSWDEFCEKNDGDQENCGVGINYFNVCERSILESGSEDIAFIYDNIKAVLEGKKEHFTMEYPCHSDDQKRWFLLYATPFSDGKRSGVVLSHVNITKRKMSEHLYAKQEKLSAIGQLSSMVYKQMKAPLQQIKNELAQVQTNQNYQLNTNQLEKDIFKIDTILERFLEISKPLREKKDMINVVLFTYEVINTIPIDPHKYRIHVSYNFQTDSMLLECNQAQLAQAFLTLIKYSLQEMKEGGTLTIEIVVEEAHIHFYFQDELPKEKKVSIESYNREIFSNGVENEHELHLMLVYQIIYNHNGTIQFNEPKRNRSTTHIILPRR